MKLKKLRDQLRKAERARPETFVLPEDDETLNCASCGGRGVVPMTTPAGAARSPEQCRACGGTGLRLAGAKAEPTPRKTNKLTTRTATALMERVAAKVVPEMRVTLVSEHPGDLREVTMLDHLDPDTVLTVDADVASAKVTPEAVIAGRVTFKPSMFHKDKRGFPIVAAVVSSEGTILGVIDLARGGIGVIQTEADITIEPILELAN